MLQEVGNVDLLLLTICFSQLMMVLWCCWLGDRNGRAPGLEKLQLQTLWDGG